MKFTKSERKWILETVKYDVINSSYRVLRESGMPIQNLRINLKDERGLLENYFKGLSLNEADGEGGGLISLAKNLFKDITTSIKTLVTLAASVGVASFVISSAKKAVNDNFLKKGFRGVKSAASSVGRFVTGDKVGIVEKITSALSSIIGKAATLIKEILVKIGVPKNYATAATPYVLGAMSIAGLLIIVKLIKLLVAKVKDLVTKSKSNKISRDELKTEARKMASVSLKMQQEAVSKIKDPEAKKRAQQRLNEKKKRLASA